MNPNSSTVHDQLLNVGSNHTLLKSQIATAWVSSPLTRGTPDILWSCIVTLSACVYTAIHLNIPALPTSRFRELWRKLKWVGIALFAPEVVLYTAIQQFYEAWQLAAKMNQLCRGEAEEEVGLLRSTVTMLKQLVFTSKDLDLEEAEDSKSTHMKRTYDLEFGFLIVMGGCVDRSIKTREFDYATLTPDIVLALAREGHFVDISPDTISGRSRASLIGKALKPQDVSDPCNIDTAAMWGKEQTALCLMASCLTNFEYRRMYYNPDDIKNSCPSTCTECAKDFGREDADMKDLGNLFEIVQLPELKDDESDSESCIRKRVLVCDHRLYCLVQESPEERLYWSAVDIQRWTNAAKALRKKLEGQHINSELFEHDPEEPWKENALNVYSIMADGNVSGLSMLNYDVLLGYKPNLDDLYVRDYAWWTYHGKQNSKRNRLWKNMKFVGSLLILLSFLSTAYGGIHLTALDFVFASALERWLWKFAALSIMGGFPAFIASSLLASWVQQPGRLMDSSLLQSCVKRCGHTLAYAFQFISTSILVVYGISRLYLVAESFFSLRHVPIGVYAVIPWMQFIPHI